MGKRVLMGLACLTMAACNHSGPKYNWSEYSPTLLDYYQDPKTEAAYVKNLDGIITAHDKDKSKLVPPGIYAEAGYMAMVKGDSQRAVDLFTREKETWPESAVFMDKAIANAKAGKTKSAPSAAVPANSAAAPTS